MANLIGQSLGRYHILEQLGEGGMAVVYKAYDTRLETEVAVKIIRTESLPQNAVERALKRFEREAKSLARLTHPNIVKVTDYGEYEGKPYLVMEFLPSGTLKKILNGKPMPWQEAARLLIPIARALGFSHRQGMIHRDVKPANILITADGEPMLTDFGIAKLLDLEETQELTGTSAAVGTPEYMAPEQASSKTVDHRADIYSLGVVFYEMITGRKPYNADTPMAVIIKQASEPLPRPKKFAPNLPQEVENIMLKALAKNPKDRYQDMSEFGRALERLTSGKATDIKNNAIPASGRQIKIKQPTVPRRMVISIGIIALVIGLLVILSFSLKSLPGILFPAAISSTTPTLKPASTPSNTPTPIFTATLSATHTPPASPTPALGIGSTWTRPADGMEMVYVPEGEFIMGSDDGYDDEMPVHQVFLDAFWIDRTEVTNAMYAKCVQAGSCKNPASSVRSSKYDQHPVQFVEWNDAQSYCSWAEVRLPTEAEWEKAARGTDGRTYSWGNDKDSTKYYLVYYGNYETKPVGSFPSGASPYGALDMAGGVLEWVNDWYSGTYYQTSPSSNPLGPDTGQARVLRGGTWNFSGYNVRSALRFRYNPSYTYSSLGFRCARPLP